MTHPHFVRVAPAELARLWSDRSMTRAQIAARVGLSERALTVRVRRQGLALRGHNTKQPSITDADLFAEMWAAGVGSADIASFFDVGRRTVINTRDRLGLAPRSSGVRPQATVLSFFMARTAREEQAQLCLAEMVEERPARSWGKR
jgi:hypothetical protein